MYALAADVAAQPSAVAKAAVAAIRRHGCWSQLMAQCSEMKGAPPFSDCATIRAAIANDKDVKFVDAEIDRTPYCPEPMDRSWVAVAVVGGVLGGMLLASMLR